MAPTRFPTAVSRALALAPTLGAVALFVALALPAAAQAPAASPAPAAAPAAAPAPAAATTARAMRSTATGAGLEWHTGSVEAAFEQAAKEKRPLFLFWTAVWCPPCNQVKSTVFNRQDFIERARAFVPVMIDGDAPGAQVYGTRYKVSGYPTMILFRPDGMEITRLPGEVDAQSYLDVLALGLTATRPVRELMNAAGDAKTAAGLAPADWRLLAYYAWESDEQTLVPRGELPALLARLAAAVPDTAGDAAMRLNLKALAHVADTAADKRPAAYDPRRARAMLAVALSDPARAREQFSVLVDDADVVVAYLTGAGSPERAQLVREWDAAAARLAEDARLSQADRLRAVYTRLRLAQSKALGTEKAPLPAALVEAAQAAAARADRETRDRSERQSVISSAAYVLREAGLMNESDAMLERELTRSASPYYFMQSLGSNARKRGDHDAALRWYARAYDESVGPATRLQWGAAYLRVLLDLKPADTATVEQTARRVLGELKADAASFSGRSGNVITRAGTQLSRWAEQQKQPEALARLRGQLDGLCAQLPAGSAERERCGKVFASGSPA